MFTGLHEQNMIVRIPSRAAARPFVVMGKAMKEYLTIDDVLDQPPQEVRDLVNQALAYASKLPPKPPKVKKAVAKSVVKK